MSTISKVSTCRLGGYAAAVSVSVVLALGRAPVASACDICAVYTATEQREAHRGLSLGVAEQYSHFGNELMNGTDVTLPVKEHMDSSITQFLIRYAPTSRLGVQVNIPYIYRNFTRIHQHQIQHGVVDGVGDMALVGDLLAYETIRGNSLFRLSLLGGLKFPTGNPDRLGEEFVSSPVPSALAAPSRRTTQAAWRVPARAPSGILPLEGGLHGHDLALGSGSWDGIVGGRLFWSRSRWFVTAGAQYAPRSTGSFDYRYANDLTWLGGPGWYALLTHSASLDVRAVLSGETKGNDVQQGRKLDDTAVTAIYVGPGLGFTWESGLAAEVSVDIPVVQHNTGLQLLPDVRVRSGLLWRF